MSDDAGLVPRGALGLVAVLTATYLLAGSSAVWAQTRARNCSLPPTGEIPLTHLGDTTYLGAQGGLYPQGSNKVPDSHLAVGVRRASLTQPLDAEGNPDPDGVVGFVSIGFSNTHREFREFEGPVAETPNIEPSFRAVNLAQGASTFWYGRAPAGGRGTTLRSCSIGPASPPSRCRRCGSNRPCGSGSRPTLRSRRAPSSFARS